MREPIIIEAEDGFHFIATRSFAEISLEATDIENGIYTVYDADGCKLDLTSAPNGAGIISEPTVPTDCSTQLVPKLREYLVLAGLPESTLSDSTFAELVQIGVERFLEQEPEPLSSRLRSAVLGCLREGMPPNKTPTNEAP